MTGERPHASPYLLTIDLQLFAQDKTEPATPKRRREARQKGQVARTNELGTAITLLILFPVVYAMLTYAIGELAAFARFIFGEPMQVRVWTTSAVEELFVRVLIQAARIVGPVMLIAMAIGVTVQVAQVGFLVTGEPLKPKLERLNPINGFKRMFSKRGLVELLKALLKTGIVGLVCYNVIRGTFPLFQQLVLLEPRESFTVVAGVARRIGVNAGALLLALAIADYGFQWYEHNRSLRMSKQELKEEYRQSEGDPMLRSRMRQRQREIAMRRMMHDVAKADVIITNPTHIAVALQYDPERMDVPIVLAKGAGRVAERIKEIAREHQITIVENPPLARALYDTVSLGEGIPAELYQAVAEVLAFVWRLRGRRL